MIEYKHYKIKRINDTMYQVYLKAGTVIMPTLELAKDLIDWEIN